MSVNPSVPRGSSSPHMGTEKWMGCVSGCARPSRLRQNRWLCVTETPGCGGPTGFFSVAKITGERRWS